MKRPGAPAFYPILIALLGLAAYSGTFHVPFLFDDLGAVKDNPVVENLGNFLPGGSGYRTYPLRYAGYLSFALCFRLFGQNVAGYHAVNLAIHVANALLVYLLVVLTFRTRRMEGSAIAPHADKAALLAGALFAVHPIETQAVTYIVQRLTSLAALCYLGSLVLYIAARMRFDKTGASGVKVYAPYLGSLILALLAMKTKEMAFTLPFAVLLYELSFLGGTWKTRLVFLVPMLLTLPVVPLGLSSMGVPPGEALSDFRRAAGAPYSVHDYFATELRVVTTYLRLLIFPAGQRLDYDYPIYRSLFGTRVLSASLLLSSMLAAAFYMRRRAKRGGDPALLLISFGVLWFFLTLSLESSFIPIPDVIFEHRAYLPSAGIFIAVSAAGFLAARGVPRCRRAFAFAAICVVAALTAATLARNAVWTDELRFWRDNADKSPHKARPLVNLGREYALRGDTSDARACLEEAVRMEPGKSEEAYENLANVYAVTGEPRKAVEMNIEALRINPKSATARRNLVLNYVDLKDYASAMRAFATLTSLFDKK